VFQVATRAKFYQRMVHVRRLGLRREITALQERTLAVQSQSLGLARLAGRLRAAIVSPEMDQSELKKSVAPVLADGRLKEIIASQEHRRGA